MRKRLLSIAILLALAFLPGSYALSGTNGTWPQFPLPELTPWPPTSRNAGNAAPLPQNNIELKAVGVISANSAWAVGHTGVEPSRKALTAHWNGTRWDNIDVLGLHPGEQILEDVVALAEDDVWAVGQHTEGSNFSRALITHWNGKEWTLVPVPDNGSDQARLEAIAAVKPDDIWAVGESFSEERLPRSRPLILHWDGQSWARVRAPAGRDDSLKDISVVSGRDIWAAGRRNVMHWDGRAWTEVYRNPETGYAGASSDAFDMSTFTGITAISHNDVWVVGFRGGIHSCDHRYIEIVHWDGTAWTQAQVPRFSFDCASGTTLGGIVASSADTVWAIGMGQRQGLLMRWDGKTWGVRHPCQEDYTYRLADNSDKRLFDDIAVAPGGEVYILEYKLKAEDQFSNREYIVRQVPREACPTPIPTNTPTPFSSITAIPSQPVEAMPTRAMPTRTLPAPVGTIMPRPGLTRFVPLPVPTR